MDYTQTLSGQQRKLIAFTVPKYWFSFLAFRRVSQLASRKKTKTETFQSSPNHCIRLDTKTLCKFCHFPIEVQGDTHACMRSANIELGSMQGLQVMSTWILSFCKFRFWNEAERVRWGGEGWVDIHIQKHQNHAANRAVAGRAFGSVCEEFWCWKSLSFSLLMRKKKVRELKANIWQRGGWEREESTGWKRRCSILWKYQANITLIR